MPQPLAPVLHLLDGAAEHVLGDDQPRVRCHDETFRGDQSMRNIARILMKDRERRHQLAHKAERGVGIEMQTPLTGELQNVRQPRAFDMIGNHRQCGGMARCAIDPPHPGVVAVPEVGQSCDPFAQRELERRDGCQGKIEAQDLDDFTGRAVGRDHSIANAVSEKWRLGMFGILESGHVACRCATDEPAGPCKNLEKTSGTGIRSLQFCLAPHQFCNRPPRTRHWLRGYHLLLHCY